MEQIASVLSAKAPPELGVTLKDGGADVAVFSHFGDTIWLCLFEPATGGGTGREVARWRLAGRDGDIHYGFITGMIAGQHYALRADGPYEPQAGHRFDPAKLLADPYARAICSPFVWRPELAAPRDAAIDTAAFVPRCVTGNPLADANCLPPPLDSPRLVYEVAVRTFTRLHPQIPAAMRGTLAGLAHPKTIEHLVALGVSHVELMPVAAWIDERHLGSAGLSNVWGYNPVLFTALDPRLAPGGMAELRNTVEALHGAGIRVLLDVVFNHTGESDTEGAVVSLRGLDNAVYYRHTKSRPRELINDTGCGNTLAGERAPVVRLILDSLRRFAVEAGIDGFRFDLAVAMARQPQGFSPDAPVLAAISQDPVLRNLEMIAEPWDVGPGGYQLGQFPPPWREWNDRYRDDVRRFWRGDAGFAGPFATRVSGSADVFARPGRLPAAGVNFLAAHDGFTLRDCVSYKQRHNAANGEDNRDGHGENHSWNCGTEGEASDPAVREERVRDVRALLATLFVSRGTPMLTAGDEFGRTQNGNNNAYAQDNPVTWLDWESADSGLVRYVGALASFRQDCLAAGFKCFLTGTMTHDGEHAMPDVAWWRVDGMPMGSGDWAQANAIGMTLLLQGCAHAGRLHVVFNRSRAPAPLALPQALPGRNWRLSLDSAGALVASKPAQADLPAIVPQRSVCAFIEMAEAGTRQED